MKQGIITHVNCTAEWTNPAGKIVFYHQIKIDNGDVGNIGKMAKYPNEIAVGTFIQYTIDEKKKIKILNDTDMLGSQKMGGPMPSTPTPTAPRRASSAGKKPDEFLGYAWSYAKDMIIAGKTMQDVEELNKVARYIYQQIQDMLSKG